MDGIREWFSPFWTIFLCQVVGYGIANGVFPESVTHSGGATRPRVHLGGDYFIILYSGNNFKCFLFGGGTPCTQFSLYISSTYDSFK